MDASKFIFQLSEMTGLRGKSSGGLTKDVTTDNLKPRSVNSTAPVLSITEVRFFFEGDAYFESLISAIDDAREEILMEVYIYDWDRTGRAVFEALKRARNRRVDVHLMVDGVGSLSALQALQQACDEANIDFRVYHPPLFFSRLVLRPEKAAFDRKLRAFLRRLSTLFFYANKRNHRKSAVIDRERAWVGSFNVTDVHAGRHSGAQAWRDTAVELRAEATALKPLVAAFQRAWIRSRDLDRPRWRFRRRVRRERRPPLGVFRLNDTLARRLKITRELRRRLRRARHRIWITNAYFLPRPALLRLLRSAAQRGVEVRLLLPAKTDVWMVREAGRTMLRKLIRDGVQVFEYQPVVLHAKSMIVDDWAMVGSHNLNYRSFVHDLEVDVTFADPGTFAPLVEQWDIDLQRSQPLTLRDLDSDSALRRLVGRLVYLVRYWM